MRILFCIDYNYFILPVGYSIGAAADVLLNLQAVQIDHRKEGSCFALNKASEITLSMIPDSALIDPVEEDKKE